MRLPIVTVEIRHENDIVLARQRARSIAGLLGFDKSDQTRISTAVSEIARNAYQYAGGGEVFFLIEGNDRPQLFMALVKDKGPGIANVQEILEGSFRSPTGPGLGIIGARRLMDFFQVESVSMHGTTVSLGKTVPQDAPVVTMTSLMKIAGELMKQAANDPLEEVRLQNQELLRAMSELNERKKELEGLNRELMDTNLGIVAIYAELEEKTAHISRANELKARFLSNTSHEFRTPLNSVLSISSLLLNHVDGDLTSEQEKQVTFIRKAAEGLSALVNDLLDIARIEAGKVNVQVAEFEVTKVFSALRGMFRPLLLNEAVKLIIEDPVGLPVMHTDEGKVSQILRNLVSNALKFTERGEIRVSAKPGNGGRAVVFIVSDTGIGIAPEDLENIFEEFMQVDSPLQRKVKGTGLGLPLSRKLAEFLGGALNVESTLGVGSTFSVTISCRYEAKTEQQTVKEV